MPVSPEPVSRGVTSTPELRGLIDPELPRITASLKRWQIDIPTDLPRFGWGGALVIRLARDYGRAPSRSAIRIGIAAVELWNQRVHPGAPHQEELFQADVRAFRQLWDAFSGRESPRAQALHEVLFPKNWGSNPIPEMILFLRGIVATAIVAGEIPSDLHRPLFRWATAWGLRLEASIGRLEATDTPAAWALDATLEPFPSLEQCLSALPAARIAEQLSELAASPLTFDDQRIFRRWEPKRTPPPALREVRRGTDFENLWFEPIEQAMAAWTAGGPAPFLRATQYLQHQGGKRVRPLLVLAAAAATGVPPEGALPAAAALEWIHQASLLLDDIVDEAKIRRGHPTLHHATSQAFAAGTALFVLERIFLQRDRLSTGERKRLSDAALALAEGQRSELAHTGDHQMSVAQYYRVIEAKTARLFSCAALLGADASPAAHRDLAKFGREAGLSFQVVDDILDYSGDERTLGKRPGTDLRARKITLPLLLLRDRMTVPEREQLADWLGSDDPRALEQVRLQLARYAVIDDCLSRARTHQQRALDAISRWPENPGVHVLRQLAVRFVERRQ